MRIWIVTAGICLAAAQGQAQIGYRASAPAASSGLRAYDSTYDLEMIPLNVDPNTIIGQQLYYPAGFKGQESMDGRYNMYTDNKVQLRTLMTKEQVAFCASKKNGSMDEYTNLYQAKIGEPTEEGFVRAYTPRNVLENKIFTIKGFKIDRDQSSRLYLYNFVLQDDKGQTVYYKLSRRDSLYQLEGINEGEQRTKVMPFYMVGHVQKYKNGLVGQVVYKKDETELQMYNYLTKKNEEVPARKKYTCTDYTFMDGVGGNHANPAVILKDEEGKELATVLRPSQSPNSNMDKGISVAANAPGDMRSFWTENQYKKVLEKEKEEAEKAAIAAAEQRKADSIQRKEDAAYRSTVIKKYGATVGNKILDGKVDLGMTMDMCKIAWGQPSSISKNAVAGVVLETWHYEWTRHLTFKNGKLNGFSE